MFSLTRILVASALVLTVAAAPNADWDEPTQTVTVTATTPTETSSSDCNTGGGAQCCQNVGNPNSSGMSDILNLLGIVTQGLDDLVGIACSPFVVGQDCTSAPVCCEENGIANMVSIGCIAL